MSFLTILENSFPSFWSFSVYRAEYLSSSPELDPARPFSSTCEVHHWILSLLHMGYRGIEKVQTQIDLLHFSRKLDSHTTYSWSYEPLVADLHTADSFVWRTAPLLSSGYFLTLLGRKKELMKNRTLLCPASFLVSLTSLYPTPYIATAEDNGLFHNSGYSYIYGLFSYSGYSFQTWDLISHTSADSCLSFLCQPLLSVKNGI